VKSKVSTEREKQNDDDVESEVQKTSRPTSSDEFGRTLLHRACWDGDLEKVKELLTTADRVAVNAIDHWGRSPLWCAINQGQVDTVRLLLENVDVNLDVIDSYGKSLEFRAKEKGLTEIVEMLQATKYYRDLLGINSEVSENSSENTKDKLVSIEAKLLDMEKKHALELHDLEAKHKTEIEKLEKENEEKRFKLQRKQQTEKDLLTNQLRILEAKLDSDVTEKGKTIASAPELPHVAPCPECPVCMESLMPPMRIIQCSNGHLICEICKPRMKDQKCPTCFHPFIGRAIAMEQHLRTLFMT